ncbi:MAG: hypothetical protein NC205_00950 [Prevotella sp.]|nr:hypothetical protein [Prevotella sp.]
MTACQDEILYASYDVDGGGCLSGLVEDDRINFGGDSSRKIGAYHGIHAECRKFGSDFCTLCRVAVDE